jgi:2-dehydropantoate 2-reductase
VIHVVGAGGIGCALGYALRAAGVKILIVDADDAKVAWGRQHGVGVDGKRPLPASFVTFADWIPPSNEIVVLCTKCYDNAPVLARLPQTATLVPVQNGFDPALVARRHPIEGIASFVSECLPGRPHTRITRPGDLHLGAAALPSPDTARLVAELAASLKHGPFRVRVVADIQPYKHTKLLYNAAISPLAAAAGVDNSRLLRDPLARRLFFALLRENHAILSRAGVPLGKVGPLSPAVVAKIVARPWLANLLTRWFEPSLRGTYCSMSGDLPRGRTELENYTGHLLRLAGDTPCPLNRRVYDLVVRMERDRVLPAPALLAELVA